MPARRPSWRDDKRTTAERGYGAKWQRERLRFLEANPLCERCASMGRTEPATVVNHRVPHRGDQALFWSRSNWEAVCKPHHDGAIQAAERSGIVRGTDVSGRPIDPAHPWNARRG
jgi:5-methylcytosine-specific restriction endonuclease McrA